MTIPQITDLIGSAFGAGAIWAISVGTFICALGLAISLIAWLFTRS